MRVFWANNWKNRRDKMRIDRITIWVKRKLKRSVGRKFDLLDFCLNDQNIVFKFSLTFFCQPIQRYENQKFVAKKKYWEKFFSLKFIFWAHIEFFRGCHFSISVKESCWWSPFFNYFFLEFRIRKSWMNFQEIYIEINNLLEKRIFILKDWVTLSIKYWGVFLYL